MPLEREKPAGSEAAAVCLSYGRFGGEANGGSKALGGSGTRPARAPREDTEHNAPVSRRVIPEAISAHGPGTTLLPGRGRPRTLAKREIFNARRIASSNVRSN